jgi:fructose-1-phosphate kinase PfkB-like protein
VEAAELLGPAIDLLDGAAVHAALPQDGATVLAITLGEAGAVLYGPAGSFVARAPALQPQDTVGAGDCFVAGMATALLGAANGRSPEEAVKEPATLRDMLALGVAAATASTLTVGAGRVRSEDIKMMRERVSVEVLGSVHP